MDSTTYISDLPPENITYQLSSVETKIKKEAIQAPMYAPLDVHKNPYLQDSPSMDSQQMPSQMPSQMQGQMPSHMNVSQQYAENPTSLGPRPPLPLPSRDIPQNRNQFMDLEAQPNYIPQPKLTRDFVRDNDELTESRLLERKRRKKREQVWRLSWDELQLPVLLAVLFFLFQLPWLHQLLNKYVTYVPLFREDGLINMYGMGVKAGLFAAAFYVLNKFTDVAALPPAEGDDE